MNNIKADKTRLYMDKLKITEAEAIQLLKDEESDLKEVNEVSLLTAKAKKNKQKKVGGKHKPPTDYPTNDIIKLLQGFNPVKVDFQTFNIVYNNITYGIIIKKRRYKK